MGLSKEVKNFFLRKINEVLDARIKEAYKGIDDKAVDAHCLNIFLKEHRIEKEYNEIIQVKNDIKKLENRKDELQNILGKEINSEKGYGSGYYWGSNIENVIENTAIEKYKADTLKTIYPIAHAEAEKLKAIRDDAEGVILLATSEPKLIERLNKVLKKYGGEIEELLDFLPEE